MHPTAVNIFKDSYAVEFLNLPAGHSEVDLHRALVRQLKDFVLELGRDFCFAGSEYPLQVGGRDFTLDLLFVEYALSRSLSPALIAEYTTLLPDKKLLQAKLHEFYQLAESAAALPNDQAQSGDFPCE